MDKNKVVEIHKLMSELMNNVNQVINYMINDMELEDDDYLTSKNPKDVVLIATTEEFMVVDKDKFRSLEISKNNRFEV